MLTLRTSILIKYMALYVVVFFFMYIISYTLMQNFLLTSLHHLANAKELEQIIQQFNIVCVKVLFASIIALSLAFYISKRISDRVSKDVLEIKEYLENINSKDYESVIKIEHYVEFLEISILLKNIVKRLKQKEKKS